MWSIYKICHSFRSAQFGVSSILHTFNNVNILPRKASTILTRNFKTYHLARRKEDLKTGYKSYLILKLGFGVATGCGIKALNWKTIFCDAGRHLEQKTRLVGLESESAEPDFNWRRFWAMLNPYMLELVGAVLAALVCAFLNIQIPRVLGSIINVVQARAKEGSQEFLVGMKMPATMLVGMYVAQSVFTFFYIFLLSDVGESIAKQMKRDLFSSIIKQDIAFFDKHRTGELINRLTVDIHDFKSAFKMVVSQGLRNTAQLIGCTITLFLISPQMTAVMMLVVPTVIGAGTLVGSLLRKTSHEAKAQSAKVTLVSEEAISNIRTVRAFAMEDVEERVFNEQAEKARELNVKLGFGIGLFQAGTNLFLNTMVLGTIYLGGYMLSRNEVTGGDIMAFMVAVQMLQRSFTQLSLLFGTYVRGIHAGARVFEMIDMAPDVNLKRGKIIPYHSLIANVEFRNVKFTYPGRPKHEVLKDFTLNVPVGKTVAIVGSSGSGKSTVAWLLERFYDVNSGSILVAGTDIRDLNPSWLRGRVIGFISQEPVLFATSVMENIRYGRPDASDREVIEAAKLANADQFIREFPDGYNTMVGERGVSVSGGQKQRIAIARALLKNPSILILDEATSALDTESEKVVQMAIDKVIKQKTTIVIAHRLSTVKNADLIVVLNDGVIVEVGSHDELLLRNGFYAQLVRQQQLYSDKSN